MSQSDVQCVSKCKVEFIQLCSGSKCKVEFI